MIMLVSQIVLVLISGILMYLSYRSERRDLIESIIAASSIITDYSVDALISKDPEKTWEGLKALKTMDAVNIVCMYDADRFYFSGYAIDPEVTGVCPVIQEDIPGQAAMEGAEHHVMMESQASDQFRSMLKWLVKAGIVDVSITKAQEETDFNYDHIKISHTKYQISVLTDVMKDGKRYGALYVSANMMRIWEYLWNATLVTLGLMIFGTLLALVMSSYLHKTITVPIGRLVKVSQDLAETANYDVRVESTRIRDVNILVDAFNTMIERIQERDRLLLISKLEADEAREEAEDAKLEAQKASRMKSEFLANMSHELRTPLNSLLILAEYFRRNKVGNLTQEQIQDAETIHSSGKDLLLLINDILDLSKVEAGKMDVHTDEIRTTDLVSTIENKFRPMAKEKNLYFNTIIDPSVPSYFISDKIRVEQVIRNFLSNAFKFTHEGGVTFKVKLAEPHIKFQNEKLKAGQAIAISITDTGIGIEPEKKEIIFKAFQQADGTTSRKYGGTGLGLSICMKFAKLLGGEISLDSKVGKETTFTIYLPFFMAGAAEDMIGKVKEKQRLEELSVRKEVFDHREKRDRYPDIADLVRKRKMDQPLVLVIEQEKAFAGILKKFFMEWNCVVIQAENAEIGLFHAKNYELDLIVVDNELPGMDGCDFINEYTKRQKSVETPYILMSNTMDSIKSYKKDALELLEKPVSTDDLNAVLAKIQKIFDEHCPELTIKETVNISTPAKENKKVQKRNKNFTKQVLIVDSSIRDIYRLTPILKEMQYEVVVATNGESALEEMQRRSHVDAVIIGNNMSGVKKDKLLEEIPDKIKNLPLILMFEEETDSSNDNTRMIVKKWELDHIETQLKAILSN